VSDSKYGFATVSGNKKTSGRCAPVLDAENPHGLKDDSAKPRRIASAIKPEHLSLGGSGSQPSCRDTTRERAELNANVVYHRIPRTLGGAVASATCRFGPPAAIPSRAEANAGQPAITSKASITIRHMLCLSIQLNGTLHKLCLLTAAWSGAVSGRSLYKSGTLIAVGAS
jgi:hypothetical protein